MGERIRREEAGYAVRQGRPVGPLVSEFRHDAAKVPVGRALHPAPEFVQSRQTVLRRVSGDQAGVDGSDGRADDPVRLDASFLQRLVHARLVGSQCAPALQNEYDLAREAGPVECAALRDSRPSGSIGCSIRDILVPVVGTRLPRLIQCPGDALSIK